LIQISETSIGRSIEDLTARIAAYERKDWHRVYVEQESRNFSDRTAPGMIRTFKIEQPLTGNIRKNRRAHFD
jgi:hypothetical protein